MRMFTLIALLASLCASSICNGNEPYVFVHENVLGSTLELRVVAKDLSAAEQAEKLALAEIDRLTKIFSTYDSQAEFAKWQRQTEFQPVSQELSTVLKRSDYFLDLSGGAFHPGAAALSKIWESSSSKNQVPDSAVVQNVVAQLKKEPWCWNDRGYVKPNGEYSLTLNAIAKGYITELTARKLIEAGDVDGVVVNIGGDLAVGGDFEFPVVVRHPYEFSVDQESAAVVVLKNAAIATSGHYYRSTRIDDKSYSHIFDPRTGSPVENVISATVIADNAMDADAFATLFSVLTPSESLKIADEQPGVACLLVDRTGKTYSSKAWSNYVREQKLVSVAKPSEDKWNGGMELAVDFEINQVGGGRYRRPYVAVWVEDKDGFPVKTLVLWVQSTGPGPRWIPDLRRWHKSDRYRAVVDDTDLVKTVSEATKKPGKYDVVWNGKDDHGKLVKPGKYTVYVEAVREHGTYQLIRKEVEFGEKDFTEELKGNDEIKSAKLTYRKAIEKK